MRHHHNLVNEAREDLRSEMTHNHNNTAANLRELQAYEERLTGNLKTLLALREGKVKTVSLPYDLSWKALGNSAWKTAVSSGAIAYMDFEAERNLGHVYYIQEDMVTTNLSRIMHENALALAPISFLNTAPVKKEEVQLTIERTADLLADVKALQDLLTQLDQQYVEELNRL